jgi:hypothetical protein
MDSATSALGATIGRGLSPTTGSGTNATVNDQAERDFYNRVADEQARQADREYKLNRNKLDQDYKIAKLNAKTARERNEIDKWYNQEQVRLAGERLAFDRESFEKTHQLNQAKLGYDLLGKMAELRGPENYYQSAAYARGVANDPNSATFLNALKNNVNMPDFGAQYGVPDPETLSTLSSKLGTPMGAGPASSAIGAGGAQDNSLNQIRGLYAAGAHRLGAGALESLTDTERKLLTSGIDAIGGDASTFMDQYRRSRIGQGVSGGYAAA